MTRQLLRIPSVDVVEQGAEMDIVSNLLGDDFSCPDLFTEMDVLRTWRDDYVWKEMARWVKYEEAVEEGGERWSKPHVSSLPMEALMELQILLGNCPVLLDLEAYKMSSVADKVITKWYEQKLFANTVRNHIRTILLKQHHFQYQHKHREDPHREESVTEKLQKLQQKASVKEKDSVGLENQSSRDTDLKNIHFMKKIPHGAKVVNMWIGESDVLDRMVGAFIRLKEATNLGDITEVPLETKFMFILLGPPGDMCMCAEIARCLGALFTDEVFRCVAFRAKCREDILAGIKEFSRYLTVLPPGTWDPTTRIEPLDSVPTQDYRKGLHQSQLSGFQALEDKEEVLEPHCDPTLRRTGMIFGGLIQDIKRKAPWYMSDFQDAFHVQCIASFFFLFLVTLTPNITFGGLLGTKTEQYMGTMECILAAAISGVLFALFSGQPLNILGSTGPMLVMEEILFNISKDNDWDYMPFRCWVGLWTALFILLVVAFDLSALVRYITRFTEESFACLIALIFIVEAFKKTFGIEHKAPFQKHPEEVNPECFCVLNNMTMDNRTFTSNTTLPVFYNGSLSSYFGNKNCTEMGGIASGAGCDTEKYVPDVFFVSLILFFGTYILATILVKFRNSLFFPMWVRHNVSDFGVLISIVVWVIVDVQLGLPTPKLIVPAEFRPSKAGRPWIINPVSPKNPWWLVLVSIAPALLATILIYMDQQITAVIVNRKENLLKKGSGYHLDMLVLAILIIILSVLGLPWYVAATVTALAHIMSLRKESECTAPGEKPMFLGIREQRVTNFLVGVFSGLAVFITSVLKYIPMPVLFGVFLYMGVAPLGGMQLIHRILLIFMPAKYQPDYDYLRHVPIKRVHMFTAIQIVCLVLLWIVKTIKKISIAFPLMVLIICFVRKGIEKIFTQRELRWLDDILPPIRTKSAKSMESLKTKETDLSDEEAPPSPTTSVKPSDFPMSKPKTSPSSPRSSLPFTIPVYPEKTKKVSQVSRQSLASLMDIDDSARPQPRYSVPFLCRSDLSTLKETSSAAILEKRKSIISERKLSRQSSESESDEESHVKKLSVTSLPNENEIGKRVGTHAYSRLTSISNDTLEEEGESVDDTGNENKRGPNVKETDRKMGPDHL